MLNTEDYKIFFNACNNDNIDEKVNILNELFLKTNENAVRITLIEALIKKEDNDALMRAKEINDSLYDIDPDRANYYSAKIAKALNDIPQMIECYEKMLNTKFHKKGLEKLSVYYFEKSDYKKAKYYYELLVEISRKNAFLFNLAKCCYYLKLFDEAERYFLELKEKNYKSDCDNLYLGRIEFMRENKEKAEEFFSQIENEEMKNLKYEELAKIYMKEKDFEKARECFRLILDKKNYPETKKLNAIFQIAVSYFLEKNYNQSEIYFLEVLKVHYNKTALVYLSSIYTNTNQKDKAIKCLEIILENQYDKSTLISLSLLYKDIDPVKSRELLTRIADTEYDEFTFVELGRLYMKEKNYDLAKYYLKKVKSKNKYALTELGIIEVEQKHYKYAITFFEQILEKGYDEYAELMLGKANYALKNYDIALPIFNKLLNTSSRPFILFELGFDQFLKKNYKEALEKFLEIEEYSKGKELEYNLIYLYIAKCEYELGNKEKTDYYYDKHIKYNNYEPVTEERKNTILSLM